VKLDYIQVIYNNPLKSLEKSFTTVYNIFPICQTDKKDSGPSNNCIMLWYARKSL